MKNANINPSKKICIIRSNPVRPDSRVEKEAWSLAKAGYDVHILAWDRDTNVHETEDIVKVAELNISITRLGHKASFGEGFKNLRAYLEFQFHMRKWLSKHWFDAVHACDFDTAFFSHGVVKRKKEKFVFDIFDFLADAPRNLMQRCVKAAQIHLINSADATIICTEERKRQIAGSKPKRLCVIHNTPFAAQIGNDTFINEESDKIRIAYIGILQDYRLLKEIAEVVAESDNMEFHIGGFGKYDSYFTEMDQKYENIKFYGRLTYDQTLALEKSCDVMVAVYDPTISNHRYAAPNKFYESLMLGKPVVMVKGTGMSQVVAENHVGVLINFTKEGFLDGMKELTAQREEWTAMGEKMKAIYYNSYSWDTMNKRLLDLYSNIFTQK